MAPPETPHTDVAPNIPQFTQGDRMRKAREHAGIAAGKLAEQLGVSRQTISNYENDHVRVDRRTLISWSFITGVPIQWIEHGTIGEVIEAGRDERRGVAASSSLSPKKRTAEGRRRSAVNRRQGRDALTDPGTNFQWNTTPVRKLRVLPSAS